MVPSKPTVCHRVLNFVRTVEHGEGTRRGVEQSVSTLLAQSFGHALGGYKRWHMVRTRYEDSKRTWGWYEAVLEPFMGRCPYFTE